MAPAKLNMLRKIQRLKSLSALYDEFVSFHVQQVFECRLMHFSWIRSCGQ